MTHQMKLAAFFAAAVEFASPAMAAQDFANAPLPVPRPNLELKSVSSTPEPHKPAAHKPAPHKRAAHKPAAHKPVVQPPYYIARILENIKARQIAAIQPVFYDPDLDLPQLSLNNVKGYVDKMLGAAIDADFERDADKVIGYCYRHESTDATAANLCDLFDDWLIHLPVLRPENTRFTAHGQQARLGRAVRASSVSVRFAQRAPR